MNKYRVHGCIVAHDEEDGISCIERVEDERAGFWSVYEVRPDGMEECIADFYGNYAADDAALFALAKEGDQKRG